MKTKSLETVEHIYDTNLVKEALYYIEQMCTKGNTSKESASRIVNTAKQILSTIKERPIITNVESDKAEAEVEAREYFGNDFIAQFEKIRKKLDEQNVTLFIHGTDVDIANKVMKDGFEAKNPSITSTAVLEESYEDMPEYNKFANMIKWPHRNYKGLVLIGLPKECFTNEAQPVWEHRPIQEGDVKTDSSREYVIRPEYIVGVIDVLGKQIIENPTYTNEHSYEGLLLDDYIAIRDQKNIKLNNENELEFSDDSESEVYGESVNNSTEISAVEIADRDIEEIAGFYRWILLNEEVGFQIVDAKGGIVQDASHVDGTDKIVEVTEVIDDLMGIIPNLSETKDYDYDNEIDDFISNARITDINMITNRLKKYNVRSRLDLNVDWREENTELGTEKDDWD